MYGARCMQSIQDKGICEGNETSNPKPDRPPRNPPPYRIFPILLFAIFIFPSTLSTSPSTSSNNAF